MSDEQQLGVLNSQIGRLALEGERGKNAWIWYVSTARISWKFAVMNWKEEERT